jgi:hypothetical protein
MATRIETAEDLERIVAEQTAAIKGLGELVKAMDQRIRLQHSSIDGLHAIFVANGMAPARPAPTEDPIVH